MKRSGLQIGSLSGECQPRVKKYFVFSKAVYSHIGNLDLNMHGNALV